jgi:excisionase family DNA binding protein
MPPDQERLMKVSDVAQLFDVKPATIREWITEGKLKGTKIGKGHYWRVYASSVIALAQERHG